MEDEIYIITPKYLVKGKVVRQTVKQNPLNPKGGIFEVGVKITSGSLPADPHDLIDMSKKFDYQKHRIKPVAREILESGLKEVIVFTTEKSMIEGTLNGRSINEEEVTFNIASPQVLYEQKITVKHVLESYNSKKHMIGFSLS